MLFIPFGWWHRVRSLAPSISINRWWWTPRMTVTQGAGMVALLARQRFLAPRPLPALDDDTCRRIAGLAHTRGVSPAMLVRLAVAELAARRGALPAGRPGPAPLAAIARRLGVAPVELVTEAVAGLARTTAIADHEASADPALLREMSREVGPLLA